MAVTTCRYFTGYKPCGKNAVCDERCPSVSIPNLRVLVISLEALGAVIRSTVVLPAIKKKFPQAHITWITKKPADHILRGNPLIDRLLTTNPDDVLTLSALEFDVAYVIDKSLAATGILRHTKADKVYGFVGDRRTGAILPATDSANELWELGLNDEKKFFINKKPEAQLVIEALELGPYESNSYFVPLTEKEINVSLERRKHWTIAKPTLIGINTGCSDTIKYRKLTIDFTRELIKEIHKKELGQVVLLGGPDETVRNQRIGYGTGAILSPTTLGPRDGLTSTAACDIVVTGDSSGLHMAVAMNKWTVAWFGPTCAHEIDLYGRGVKVMSKATCGPCWKRSCDRNPMCYDLVSMSDFIDGIEKGLQWKTSTSSSKQHLSAT